jgi:hypothetical protein
VFVAWEFLQIVQLGEGMPPALARTSYLIGPRM